MVENIGRYLAKTISIVLQPLLMPFYSVSLLFLYTNFHFMFFDQAIRFLMPVFVFSFLIPSFFTFALLKLKYIKNLQVEDKNERIYLYVIFLVSNLCSTYIFFSAGVPLWFVGLILGFSMIAIVGFFINLFWKISAHMLGFGGLIGGVLSVCLNVKGLNPFVLFILLFLLAGFLGVSRLTLHRSTPSQIYIGFCLGLVLVYGAVLLGILWLFI